MKEQKETTRAKLTSNIGDLQDASAAKEDVGVAETACHVTFLRRVDGSIEVLPGEGCTQEDLEEVAKAAVDYAVDNAEETGEEEEDRDEDGEGDEDEEEEESGDEDNDGPDDISGVPKDGGEAVTDK